MELFAWISFGAAVLLGVISLAMSFKIYNLSASLTHVRGQRDSGSEAVEMQRVKLSAAQLELGEATRKAERLKTSLDLSESANGRLNADLESVRGHLAQAVAGRDEARQNVTYWKEQTSLARAELAAPTAAPVKMKAAKDA